MSTLNILNKSLETVMEEIKELARRDWGGKAGEQDYNEMGKFLNETLDNYEKNLGIPKLDILIAIEDKRDYNVRNYYQRANFPLIENIDVYETIEDFKKKFPSGQFICPCCENVSTDPQTCNSGKEMSKGKKCDWKSWGLLGTAGKGYSFIIKQDFLKRPIVWNIFKPKELD